MGDEVDEKRCELESHESWKASAASGADLVGVNGVRLDDALRDLVIPFTLARGVLAKLSIHIALALA